MGQQRYVSYALRETRSEKAPHGRDSLFTASVNALVSFKSLVAPSSKEVKRRL